MDKSRRKAIKTVVLGGVAATAIAKAPYVFAREKVTLRILGTHVTLQEELRQKAMEDLGIHLIFEPKGSAAVLQKASMFPESFDLFEQWSNSINVLWRSGAIQSIDKRRITHWDEINNLTKTGKIAASAKLGAGDAPYKLLHIQKNGQLGINHTNDISFLPLAITPILLKKAFHTKQKVGAGY
jgi:putative spermidine/putrescine transport system substrate-binding protein